MLATCAGRQRVCGVIGNEHLNVAREYDVLKAIRRNSRVHGPASQNRQNALLPAVPHIRRKEKSAPRRLGLGW